MRYKQFQWHPSLPELAGEETKIKDNRNIEIKSLWGKYINSYKAALNILFASGLTESKYFNLNCVSFYYSGEKKNM